VKAEMIKPASQLVPILQETGELIAVLLQVLKRLKITEINRVFSPGYWI